MVRCWKSYFQIIIGFLFLLLSSFAHGQISRNTNQFGLYIKKSFSNTAFPDSARVNGHAYQGKLYDKDAHYSDNNMLIFIPKDYKQDNGTDLIFHFHGWYNNIDSVPAQFLLPEQLYKSGKNAILIIPQGPKNAPDSYGGKLERKDVFAALAKEVMAFLYQEKFIQETSIRNIILSGHSGAYRVMAHILQHGGLSENIKETWLFDGLYSQEEKYLQWLKIDSGSFTNIYTRDGGTYKLSKKFEKMLQKSRLPFVKGKNGVEEWLLRKQEKIRSIYSPLGHNEVMHKTDQFRRLIENSAFLE